MSILASEDVLVTEGAAGTNTSAVAWGAVIAGAFAAAALSLILLTLGAGFGFISASPWAGSGPSATAFGLGAAVWLIIVQIVAAGLGGYLAARLRRDWSGVIEDENHFRDTAHGFLAWTVGAVLSAALLTSATSTLIGGAAQAGATVAGGAAQAVGNAAAQAAGPNLADPNTYLMDTLFRPTSSPADASDATLRGEVARIIARSVANGSLAPADRTYIAELIVPKTGLSQPDAEKRVDDIVAQAKAAAAEAEAKARQAADVARKAAAYGAFFFFFSMLVGAFTASYAGMVGGQHRNHVLGLG